MMERTTGQAERPGLLLAPPTGRRFHFDPGALCLELLATGGPGEFARFEVLHEPADLVRWAGESRLRWPSGLELAVGEGELKLVRRTRDALFQLAADRAHDRPLGPGCLSAVNAAAAEAPLTARIEPDGTRAWAPGATGTRLLSSVMRDAVDLFTGPFAHRVRECGGGNCSLLFVDTSRPGRRRWCSMERCGNRQKARVHRARGETVRPASSDATRPASSDATQPASSDAARTS
ncbi:CGNR zinc finger domain-containing protein [Streptomyces sp. NBC_01381]|uniref:CGNR zinc finger domain-containing protein n=1 Tax=Streptomyces sp. NBC_01381 TaxID=2903845 RepID=UPI002254A35B|nr:CGNR zinc finger domain-containing protein [Streptomyces sp. NBC_01381]MCX4665151.1 CGNR zinc finger domain-containing protein [Streptomyces sp. NBC_01381]